MREILFRGKRKDNGEWVEGDLVHGFNEVERQHELTYIRSYGDQFETGAHEFEVINDTVCQYTGLVDRKDRKIFEGDIVRDPGVSPRYPGVYVVEFDYGSFGLRNITNGDICITPFDDSENYIDAFSIEVVGNIHDNPELLEVKL